MVLKILKNKCNTLSTTNWIETTFTILPNVDNLPLVYKFK